MNTQQILEELNQQIFEMDIDFDDLEKEVYECYDCAWVGSSFVEQEASLFGTEEDEDLEKILLCPVCGKMLT